MIQKSLCSLLLLASFTTLAPAQGFMVDISNSGRPVYEGNDPQFTPWSTTQSWLTSGTNTSTFGSVTVKFAQVGPVGAGIESGYYKWGVQNTAWNAKLPSDGIMVDTGDAGAQIEMRISGLSAGSHSLLLYLNSWDSPTDVAPLDIFVDGAQVVNDLPVSVRATNVNAIATAYLNVTAVAGQDVSLLIKAETSGAQAYKNVHINGFEIDLPDAKARANNPVPYHADEHVDADNGLVTLSWGAAVLGAVSHNVYFGTSSNAVKNATTASPEFKGNQAGNSFLATNINSLLTYYWRVDEVDATNGVAKGVLWYFRPRHLAFPGAEGYGRHARGGRGGVVVKVTNLNDSGAGSLRDAIEGNYGPRTVIFDVSGLLTLQDDIIINGDRPYITVAGQTAPGKGICIKRQQLAMSGARDCIIRFMRVRVGQESGETQNGSGMAGADYSIMDHCSVSWGQDEEISSREAKNMTLQRVLISEALHIAGHDKYPAGTSHGYAASIGGDIASFHHNLLAHNEGRNWSLAGGVHANGFYSGRLDIFNNVVYNWDGRTTDGGAAQVNFVGNYYKPGPEISTTTYLNPDHAMNPDGSIGQAYYSAGNTMPGYPQTNTGAWMTNVPFFPSHATIDSATNAYKKVLSDVGCNQPMYDDHDVRVIRETIDATYTYNGSISGRHGLPDTTADVGGWENYGNEVRPANFDTDNDGMPDWWEVIKGFNTNSTPGDFSESNSDGDGDGYVALEDYLNWLAEPHYDCNAGTNVDVDLHALSRGFTNSSPSYTFSQQAGGNVTLIGGRYARFTPAISANALGGFNYTVTDSQGYTMTRAVNMRIIGNGTTPTNPPAAPTGVNATAGDAQVSLGWNVAAEATGYIVKRSTVNGGPYASIVTNTSVAYVNTGLINNTTYYYVISAFNAAGESTNSLQVNATPLLAVPSVPTNLTAIAGFTQVTLSWAAASGATNYIVKRSTVSGGPYAYIATNATTTFTNTGLVNGTTYYFVVSGLNGVGESANSSQTNATPQISAPTGLSAAVTNGQVSLSWNASAGATSYIVKRTTINGGPYTIISTNVATTFTNTGLGNGITYYFVVSALGASGVSVNSSQISAIPSGPPGTAPLVYEGFSYTTGTIIGGQTGGGGWGTAWQTSNAGFNFGTNNPNGLTYGWLITSDNALQLGYPQPGAPGGSTTANPQRILPTTLGNLAATNGGVLWVSYLMYNPPYPTVPGKYYRQSNLGMYSGAAYPSTSGSDVASFGMPNTSATVTTNFAAWGGTVVSTAPNMSTVSAFSTNVQLILLKLVVDNTAATDTYYAWLNVNPSLLGNNANTPDISTANVTNSGANLSSVNAFRLQAGNNNGNGTNAFYLADEFRLGGSFAAVTPSNVSAPAQPPTLGIRVQSGALFVELTGESGRSLTVQSKTNLASAWLDWTNLTGSGTMQLLPLNGLTNQDQRYFRALAQ